MATQDDGDGEKEQLTSMVKTGKDIIDAAKASADIINSRVTTDAGLDSDRVGPESGTDSESNEAASDMSAVESTSLNRRQYLTAMGASTVVPAIATGTARADGQGYGAGEYGSGPYGDPVDESDDEGDDEKEGSVAVKTYDATDVDNSSVTLSGALTELEGYDEATVYFKWDESGGELSKTTEEQTLESTSEFSDEVTGLESDTEYEFYAYAESGDETDSNTGETLSFTTESSEDEEEEREDEDQLEADPKILELSAENISNPRNPHVDAAIDWVATIEEGELDAAELTVSDTAGEVLSWEYDLGGQTADGSEEERIKHGSGETYTVELTVYSAHDTTEFKPTTFDS